MLKEIVMDSHTYKAYPDAEQIKEPDNSKKMKESTPSQRHRGSSGEFQRKQRPARLLPTFILHGNKPRNDMSYRFYGPPTNCSGLSLLGYTLNGFYQVLAKNTSDEGTGNGEDGLEAKTIYCTFKHSNGSDIAEKRVVSLKIFSGTGGVHFNVKMKSELKITLKKITHIRFDVILLNVGDGFNRSTGFFRAPKTGIYQFTFSGPLISHSVSRANHNEIMFGKNDMNYIIHSTIITDNQMLNRFVQTTTKLKRGEKISVIIQGANQTLGISTFSGSLLEEL